MDFVTPVFEICGSCWDRTSKYRLLIKGLRNVLKDLSFERDKLVNLSEDVKQRVDKDDWERHRPIPTSQVTGWWKIVEDINNQADGILKKGQELDVQKKRSCLGVGTNFRSRYKLAKEAEQVKSRAVEVLNAGLRLKDGEVTYEPAENTPMMRSQEPSVGMVSMFDSVWELVEDETVRSIGLFGVGGVGKTTLLKNIHDHFIKTNYNNAIIWVVVSQHASVDQVQRKIWDKLNFSDEEWNRTEKEDRAMKIQNFLSGRNFILFLDDLWESVDLADVGIPHNSKVIFTTRSEEVCGLMGSVRRMKVECLPPKEAIELFRKKVGEETWNAHHQIPELAEIVVRECQFLPLALVTIGAAMVFKKELLDWENVVQVLTTHPAQFTGMQEKVLSRLEISYRALPDETHRKCFLFCCIFPEDYEMVKDDLVQLWIGEGFFDQNDDTNIHTSRYHANNVIRKLTNSCLLEETINRRTNSVYKMHDLVREMGLWVASEHGKGTSKIVVQERQQTVGLNEFERWKEAEMISMVHAVTIIREFPTTMPCLNLSTLLLRYTDVERFPSGFFSCMPCLKVLDLSYNVKLQDLAGGDIGQLTNLQYLNLVGTRVEKLPEEFKNLVKLRFLFLNKKMIGFPQDVLSKIIPSLRMFSNTSDTSGLGFYLEESCPKLLESLQRMELDKSEICLMLRSASEVKQLLSDPRLVFCLRGVSFALSAKVTSISFSKHVLRRMNHLESLSFEACSSLAEISVGEEESSAGHIDISIKVAKDIEEELHFASSQQLAAISNDCFRYLRKVHVVRCPELLHLTSLILYTPNLEELLLYNCRNMTQVVRSDEKHISGTILSRLTVLRLNNLPRLKSISRRTLPFSSLKVLRVHRCGCLRKLPFNQLQRLQRIEGNKEWWEKLKWDDVATQHLLTPIFHNY